MKDFLNKILSISGERISHPIFGSFILSWIAFNWEALAYFFFYDENMKDKIDYISQRYNNVYYLLWFPIISTLVYKLVLPYISTGITYLLNKNRQLNTEQKKKVLEDIRDQQEEEIRRSVHLENFKIKLKEQLNNKGEVEGLLKQLEDRDALIERERDRSKIQSEDHRRNLEFMEKTYVTEINTLKSNLALLQNENSAFSNSVSELKNEATHLRLELLEAQAEIAKKPLTLEEIRSRLKAVNFKNDTPNSELPDEG